MDDLAQALTESLDDDYSLVSKVGDLAGDAAKTWKWLKLLHAAPGYVSDKLLEWKIVRFLKHLQNETNEFCEKQKEDRGTLLAKTVVNLEDRKKMGEFLLLTIDNQIQLEKIDLIAMVFAALLRETIDYNSFVKMTRAVDKVDIENVTRLESIYTTVNTGREITSDIDSEIQDLSNAGFLSLTFKKIEGALRIPEVTKNKLGADFVKLVLRKDVWRYNLLFPVR